MFLFAVTGNVGADSIIGTSKTNKILNFTLCNKEIYKAKNGETKENISWFSVVSYYPLDHDLQKFAQHVKKGTKIYVSGTIAPAHYHDKDGNIKNKIVVTAKEIELL